MRTGNFYRDLTCVCNASCQLAGNNFSFILCDLCAEHLETKLTDLWYWWAMVPSNLSEFLVRIPRNLDKYDSDLAANTINQQSSTNPVVTYHQSQISVLWNVVSLRKVDNHSSVMSFMTTRTAIVSNFTKTIYPIPNSNDEIMIPWDISSQCIHEIFVLNARLF